MTRLRWSSMNMFCKVFLVSVVAQYTFGLDALRDVKNDLLTSTRTEGDNFLRTDQGRWPMAIYPTLEEIGLNNMVAERFDSDFVYGVMDYHNQDTGDILSSQPAVEKRPNIKLIPRIGRKKRSLADKQQMEGKISNPNAEKMSEKDAIKPDWNDEGDRDYVFRAEKRKPRSRVIFIPRIGKKSYEGANNPEDKRVGFIPRIGKKSYEDANNREDKRAVFIPRIGKKSYEDANNREDKRVGFIPRIGKKSYEDANNREDKRVGFIPRIGKKSYEDPNNREDKRAVFIPRIGKKSYEDANNREDKRVGFIPRIGKKSYEDAYNRENKRVVFIPRIGRSSFIPNAHRYNSQNRLKGRAIFIPRIG